MAVNNVVYVNECGLPLNATEWLVKHHQSKACEREQMIQDIKIKAGSFVVDAGCGPGVWTPLLARAVGSKGRILGIDISAEALLTAEKRCNSAWYQHQVQYKYAPLERLPLEYGTADFIFSANVSQYLPNPGSTFAAMGPYLKQGGQLVVKDIDFSTIRFSHVDARLQARILQARERWERERVGQEYSFEDSWVGSKLAGYLSAAGYKNIQEKTYRIVRHSPLSADFRFYLQGIAAWFISEGAPYLSFEDTKLWSQYFLQENHSILDTQDFVSEETEFVASGVWDISLCETRYEKT